MHAKYHPYFRTFLRDRGYYDVFLFDENGNLIYSVYKELDYATNLLTGQWASSDLGKAFSAGKASVSSGNISFFDFKPYKPSFDAPASFISIPLRGEFGEFAGVLVFQMPIERLNALMAKAAGLGNKGETYIVGDDYLMRNKSRLSSEDTILKKSVETESVKRALNGEEGVLRQENEDGKKVISAYKSIEFLGSHWAIVAEQEASELFAPVQNLRNQLIIQLLVCFLLISFAGVVVSRGISNPLGRLSKSMIKISKGNFEEKIPYLERKDEIGQMAITLSSFQADLAASDASKIALFKGAAFDSSSGALMMINDNFEIVFANEAMYDFIQERREVFEKEFPSLNCENIIDTSVDIFYSNPKKQRQIFQSVQDAAVMSEHDLGDMKIQINIGQIRGEDGAYAGNVLEWQDITESYSNAGILKALDSSQAIIEFKMDGTIINANDQFLTTMGYSRGEVIGKHHSMFASEEVKNSTQYSEFWQKLNRGEYDSGKYHRLGKGGKDVWIQAVYNPIVDKNGKPFKVLKIANDITAVELAAKQHKEESAKVAAEQAKVVQKLANGLQCLSDGDLTVEISEEFAGEYEQLRADFNQTVYRLKDAMQSIIANSGGIKNGANEVSQAADDLSRRTEHQAATLEETAASLEQVTATVNTAAEGAEQANSVVIDTRKSAEESGEVVREAVAAMNEIKKSSDQISQIIGVIDEIAFQTNLLALNAGVEAARAGDAGRGFAVVASEVRALAQRSSDAAKEIKELISTSSSHVKTGVDLVGEAGDALEQIVMKVIEISSLVGDITTSAQEQATGLKEINVAVSQMDQVTQQNAAMVEESTAASHSMTQDAQELFRLVGKFRTEMESEGASSNLISRSVPASVDVKEQQKMASAYAVSDGNAALKIDDSGGDDWEEF